MKKFTATYNGKEIKVEAVSASKAIWTAAKIFNVKVTKVSVRQE